MALASHTPSVSRATYQKAEKLAEMLPTFSTGRDKATGIRFVIVPSSDSPEQVGHTATALWCSCLGFQRNAICSHQIAVSIFDQRVTAARIEAAQKIRKQNGQCRQAGCIQTATSKVGRCEAHTLEILSLVADL